MARKSEKIIEYDNYVWDRLGISSRTDMDARGLFPTYKKMMKSKFKTPMGVETMRELERENYHSAYEAIGYKGRRR